MGNVGNWRNDDEVRNVVVEAGQSSGKSPFSVIFGMLWGMAMVILSFSLPFLIYFLPLLLFPSYDRVEAYISEESYNAYRDVAESFYLSTQGSTGITYIVIGFSISLLFAITSLYGKTSWRLFLLSTGFALCCLSLRYSEIDFSSETVSVRPPVGIEANELLQRIQKP